MLGSWSVIWFLRRSDHLFSREGFWKSPPQEIQKAPHTLWCRVWGAKKKKKPDDTFIPYVRNSVFSLHMWDYLMSSTWCCCWIEKRIRLLCTSLITCNLQDSWSESKRESELTCVCVWLIHTDRQPRASHLIQFDSVNLPSNVVTLFMSPPN